jgi:hypothetical protein
MVRPEYQLGSIYFLLVDDDVVLLLSSILVLVDLGALVIVAEADFAAPALVALVTAGFDEAAEDPTEVEDETMVCKVL